MKGLYFKDIFYSSDIDTLKATCHAEYKNMTTPSLILLPHSHFDYVHEMYQEAFSYIKDPKQILLLSPLHSERMEGDERFPFFTTSSDTVLTPLGPVRTQAAEDVKISDCYLEEEYAPELVYLMVAENCPNAIVKTIFTDLKTKEDSLALARTIGKIKKAENETALIVSGNFTAEGKKEKIYREASTLNELLENNAPLMEAGNRGIITGCAWRILEACRTTVTGTFSIEKASSGAYYGDRLSSEANGNIWHVYGVKK